MESKLRYFVATRSGAVNGLIAANWKGLVHNVSVNFVEMYHMKDVLCKFKEQKLDKSILKDFFKL